MPTRKRTPSRLLPGQKMDVFEEIAWQTTLTSTQKSVLRVLREFGQKGASVEEIAKRMGRKSSTGLVTTFRYLVSKKKVVKTNHEVGSKAAFRIRTWSDVNSDHIRDMARRGGVY